MKESRECIIGKPGSPGRRYSPAMKERILDEGLRKGVTVMSVCKRYKVSPDSFYRWLKEDRERCEAFNENWKKETKDRGPFGRAPYMSALKDERELNCKSVSPETVIIKKDYAPEMKRLVRRVEEGSAKLKELKNGFDRLSKGIDRVSKYETGQAILMVTNFSLLAAWVFLYIMFFRGG